MAVLEVTEQRVADVVVGALRTFVGGSKTTAYSLLDVTGIESGLDAEGGLDTPSESESAVVFRPATGAGRSTEEDPFEPLDEVEPEPTPDAVDDEGELGEAAVAGLLAEVWAAEGAAGLFRTKATAIKVKPRIPEMIRTGAFETGVSTSATKILNWPPVIATSNRTPPSTSKPIMMLWGMDRPFLSIRAQKGRHCALKTINRILRGFSGTVKPEGQLRRGIAPRKAPHCSARLLFCSLWFTNIRQEAGVGSAALRVVLAGFAEAELTVHSEVDFGCVIVLLAIVLPPADRAQRHGSGRFQRLVSTARAAKTNFQCFHLLCRRVGKDRGLRLRRLPARHRE